MYLGIEIGGTKLQLGVGPGDGSPLVAFERQEIDPREGATGILRQIRELGESLLRQHAIRRIGIGFGGPVNARLGSVIKSHQVAGWENMPLVEWCRDVLGVGTVLGNDCDVAALAEARCGAGRGRRAVFYVTVGTGIGGGFVCHGQLYGEGRPAVAEIGHLRPGLDADRPQSTVESRASGPAIAAEARRRVIQASGAEKPLADDLLRRCHGSLEQLTARLVGDAAQAGNELAQDVLRRSWRVLGWAIAQVVTLLAPEIVIVGGGLSLLGQRWFFQPLRDEVARYVFPPLSDSFEIAPAELGERVVVHGALTLARSSEPAEPAAGG